MDEIEGLYRKPEGQKSMFSKKDFKQKEILHAQEVAYMFGVSKETIKNWADNGKIKATRGARGERQFAYKDIEAMMETRTHE